MYPFPLVLSVAITTLLAHGQFVAPWAPQLISLQHVLLHGAILPAERGSALSFYEFYKVLVGLFIQLVKVPLNGTKTIWNINHPSSYCTICKLARVQSATLSRSLLSKYCQYRQTEEQSDMSNAAGFYPLAVHLLIFSFYLWIFWIFWKAKPNNSPLFTFVY